MRVTPRLVGDEVAAPGVDDLVGNDIRICLVAAQQRRSSEARR